MSADLRILIVEDEYFAREILSDILSGYGKVHIAADGQEAVSAHDSAIAAGNMYDLICMDIMMSGMNGFDAAKKIRENEKNHGISFAKRVKIVMISALEDPINVMKALSDSEADSYLVKPVDREALLEKMKELKLL